MNCTLGQVPLSPAESQKNDVGLKRRDGVGQPVPELHGNVNATALLEHEMGNSTGSQLYTASQTVMNMNAFWVNSG